MKHAKRILALLLAAVLCLSCLPGAASAAKRPGTDEEAAAPAGESRLSAAGVRVPAADLPKDEPVRVIVCMEGEPTAKVPALTRSAARIRLNIQHAALRRDLEAAGVDYELNYDYGSLLNGLALTLAYGDLERLAALPGVLSVHIANRYAPPEAVKMESSNEMTGAAWMHRGSWLGSGTVIAVLDTGITPEHEAFGVWEGMLTKAKLSEAEARSRAAALGYGAYLSQKIPFAYDYYDMDDDALDDVFGHGTHVSGIAAGYARAEDGAVRFCGTAPDAQILAMKIFSSEGEDQGTDSSVYFKALEDAYELGADVINMSIGAQNGFTYDAELEDEVYGDIYQTLRDRGVAVVVAAGNEGSMADNALSWAGPGYVTADYADYGVVGSPATYGGNLAVASAENARYPVRILRAGDRDIVIYDGDGQFFPAFAEAGTMEYVVIPGFGAPEDYEGLMVRGRIALVSRGELTFQEKLNNAADAGAAGLLVWNNEPGALYMSIDEYWIPAAAVTQEDGQWLIERAETVMPERTRSGDDTEEDLTGVYTRVNNQSQLTVGDSYLIVSEVSSLAFNAGANNVNGKGNVLPVTIRNQSIPVTDKLKNAELIYARNMLINDSCYLTCSGYANEVDLADSPEDLSITVDNAGIAEIVANGCSFRYNQSANVFRFYLPTSGLIDDSKAFVVLYKLAEEQSLQPSQIGEVSFPAEPLIVENEAGGQMSDFSSMGVTPDLQLKPVITGVGGSVNSALFGTEDGYAVWSGTSMATPNLSGALACLLQYLAENRPELDAKARMELAEALLESTAQILIDAEGQIVTPRKQGAGLIDLEAAAGAKAVVTTPILSLGDDSMGVFNVSFDVRSLSDKTLVYTLDLIALRDAVAGLDLDEDGEYDLFYNSLQSLDVSEQMVLLGDQTIIVPPGETVTVSLIIAPRDELVERYWADFPNGGFLDGYFCLSEAAVPCDGGETCPGSGFTDMPKPTNWAHAGIDFVLERDLFSGASPTSFNPKGTMNRGMMVSVLYALAGRPEPQGENRFSDVKPDKYYYQAVIWASENGIVSGVSADRFNPKGSITREQMAAIFFQYAQYAGLDTEPRVPLEDYPDEDRVHSYAREAMSWAVAAGVLSGVNSGGQILLNPRGSATREQVATMFMSFVRNCVETAPQGRELHASFTAFVGDWSQAPILEQHDWREIVDAESWLCTNSPEGTEETWADLGYTWADNVDFEVNTGVNLAYAVNTRWLEDGFLVGGWLGDNPYDYADFSEDRAAISPGGDLDMVWIQPMLLRNARHLIMTVTDAETGELYCVDDTEYLPKAYYDTDYYEWVSTGDFRWDGTDLTGELLPGGTEAKIRFYANLAWGEDALGAIPYEDLAGEGEDFLVWSFSLRLDDAAPVIENPSYDPAARTLTFTVSDDRYLAYAELTPVPVLDEDDEMPDPEPVWTECWADETPGGSRTVTVEDVDPGEYTLFAADYAANSTSVVLALTGSSKLSEVHFICPEGCVTEADAYYVGDGAALTMPDLIGEPEEGAFCGWMPEVLEGIWSYEQLEESALDEEIAYPGVGRELYGESWFYAMLMLPMEYGDPASFVQDYWQSMPDYTGTWALGGFDWINYDGDYFLNADCDTVPVETDYDDWYGLTYVDYPDPSILFEIEETEDGLCTVRNAYGQYLSVVEGDLGLLEEPDERALWEIWYDADLESTMIVSACGPDELVLTFDRNELQFLLLPLELCDYDSVLLVLYGPPILSWGYTTVRE